MIDIVMTTWKRFEMTKKSILSIIKNADYPCRLIVIDNGSDYQDWLSEQRGKLIDILVLLDKNYGLETAKNIGMNFVESDLFVSTDNDILAKPGWLKQLKELIDKYPEYACIACRPQVLVGTGDIFGDSPPEVKEFSHIPGYLRIMRTDLTKKAGAWSDKRPLRGHEEYWISQKFREMGHKVGWASYIDCYHMFGDNQDWGYDGMKPEQHGHNPVGGLPKDDYEKMKEYL